MSIARPPRYGRRARRRSATLALGAVLVLLIGQATALAETNSVDEQAEAGAAPESQITICHRTNSASNPYVVITIDRNGADGTAGNQAGVDHFAEHDDGPDGMFDPAIHSNGDDWDDIIPPVDDDGNPMPHNGLNWTTTNSTGESGEDIWLNGCVPSVPNPNVAIEKTASQGTVAAGAGFTWNLTVTNTTAHTANDVVITDTIASSLTIGDLPAGCSRSGQTVTCMIGTLAGGASQTVSIPVTTSEASCPSVDNTGTVTAASDSNADDNSDSASVNVTCTEPEVTVSIVKTNDANNDGTYTDSEEAKSPGLDVPFRVVITNTSNESVTIASLTDTFPGDVIDLLAGRCSNLAGQTLDPDESVECDFTVNDYSPDDDAGAKVNTVEVCVELVGDATTTACDDDPSRVRSATVLGRTVTPPPTETPPPTRTPPSGTAFTGSEGTLGFGLLAMALLLFGTGVLYAGYRKRQSYDS